MPMVPPAPPTFSTMMVWPNVRDMWSPRRRVTTSVGPPAANGTMTVIGLLGNWAAAGTPLMTRTKSALSISSPLQRIVLLLDLYPFIAMIGYHRLWRKLLRPMDASATVRNAADRRRAGDARGPLRPGGPVGGGTSDQGRGVSRRWGLCPGVPGPHHGGYRVAWPRRGGMARANGVAASGSAAPARSCHHRSARHRPRCCAPAQAAALTPEAQRENAAGMIARAPRAATPRRATEERDDLAPLQPFEMHPLAPSQTSSGLASIKSGARCTAGFRPG